MLSQARQTLRRQQVGGYWGNELIKICEQNVRLELGGGESDGADGRHHPRHPGQHLPGPERPEQVGGETLLLLEC